MRGKRSSDFLRGVLTASFLGALLISPNSFAASTASATIQIRPYRVTLERKSATQRVFLLRIRKGQNPAQNRIILLRTADTNQNAFAVRVLRTYEGGTFAGTRVRSYKSLSDIRPGQDFIAIEKLGMLELSRSEEASPEGTPEPQVVREENINGLKEVEQGLDLVPNVLDYDPDLDAGNSPVELQPETRVPRLEIDQMALFDEDPHAVEMAFGLLRTPTPTGGSVWFNAGGFRYGRTVSRNLFLFSERTQDSLTLEGGLFVLKVNNYAPASDTAIDSYTVLPLGGTLRYNLHFNHDWSAYFYLGLSKLIILEATNFTETGTTQLSSFMPGLGGGVIYRIGPRWYLRLNLGLDIADVGIALRF